MRATRAEPCEVSLTRLSLSSFRGYSLQKRVLTIDLCSPGRVPHPALPDSATVLPPRLEALALQLQMCSANCPSAPETSASSVASSAPGTLIPC